MIKYSIIMPTYNSEKTIQYSIQSIIDQSFDNWELIIIDDGSTDKTASIVKELQNSTNKITYIYQENSGPGIARNNGINHAQGEFVAFLDSDDYWDKDFLKIISRKIDLGADYIFYDFYYERPIGTIQRTTKISKFNNLDKDLIIRKQLTGTIPWGMSKVIKKELINNSYFENLCVGEENIFSFEAIRKANKIAFAEKPVYHYVQSDDSQHTKGGLDPWKMMLVSVKSYFVDNHIFEKYSKTINSLAVRALSIACYRSSKSMKYKYAIMSMKRFINDYKRNYNLKEVDTASLNLVSIIILIFINLNWLLPIYVLSKFR